MRGLKCKTFSKEGAVVYQDAVKTFQQGNQAASQAAKENAYLYARMAERWAQIRRDYGDTAYTAKDFAAAHPIYIGGTGSDVQFGQPITNPSINLDAPAPVITIKEKYAGMDWKDLRRKLPGTVEDDIVSKKNDKGEYIPYVNEATGNKVIVTKKSVDHFKTDHTSNAAATKNRQNTLHYEMIEAIPDIIRKGIWVESHMDSHGKVPEIIRIVAPVHFGDGVYAVKLTVKKQNVLYQVEDGEYTSLNAYDVETKKEPIVGSTSTDSHSNEVTPPWPVPTIGLNISIRDFLRNVNDNLSKPYINSDGTPNYGIYFGDNKTGGVMYIGSDGYKQTYRQGKIRGAFDASTGAIHLFDAADQSSFIHESAHMYLTEMERMVQEEGAPKQLVEDWHTIQDWASYAGGRLDDYKGTRLEKEFAGYEAAIRKARESGDTVAIKAAEERWMQERFARAFERYIAEGKAPIKELQGPFRRFKKWLIGIYRDLRNLGKEPTDDVRLAMDRMVASDDEIDAWARIRELDAWNRKGFSGDLSGSEGTMIHQWAEKIKEQAKEKLLAQYEEEARQRDAADRQQGLEEERLAYQKQLCTENPIYQYENIYNNMPEARAGILAKLGYADDAEFKHALKAAGGSMEERTDQYVESSRTLHGCVD